MRKCELHDLGRITYGDALGLQRRLVEQRKSGAIADQFLIAEHPHVITLGRNGRMDNLLASEDVLRRAGVAFFETDRGGDITYHGPGQVVGYPILDLREWKRDVAAYVRALEQVIIDALADFGFAASRVAGLHRRVGGRPENRRHRRSHQPLGDLARLRAQRCHGPRLFPVHRALRPGAARHLDGGAGRGRIARGSDRLVVQTLGPQFPIRNRGPRRPGRGGFMIDVIMPQMGESIVEGTLTKWLKKPGDHVERDEPLFEISTDKVDTEIPAPAAGTLAATLVEEGKTVGINTVVARIDETGGAAVSAPPKTAAAPWPAPAPAPPPSHQPVAARPAPPPPAPPQPEVLSPVSAPAPEPVMAAEEAVGPLSPLVRRIARENNIDLGQVKGTGAGGRITKQDLEAFLARREAAPARPGAKQPQPRAAAPPMPPPAAGAAPLARPETAKLRVEPMSIMRTKIAEHMVLSKRTSAHVTTVHKVDMTRVAKMRARHRDEVKARYGYSLTYLPFVARAASEALRAYPLANASIEGGNIIYHNEINIGIAVALENGLIVPVIRNADEKNVLGLQHAIADLSARARSRQLKPDEVQGGTFSITNFGSFGSLFGTPIINQPQVAILGLGAVEKTPVVTGDDAIAIRSISLIGLTFDHRLIDGAYADQFMTRLKSVLEDWSEEVL